MTNPLADQQAREEASRPTNSYIVQAPAGSGKTELLTQRFLRLLCLVRSPEHIVALTFTRKAANEMRERILLALNNAQLNIKGTSPHQQTTFHYAALALDHAHALQWNLLEHPGRLRITTIDSLCQTLTQAIPLNENQTPYAAITNTPKRMYETAADACFRYALDDPQYQKPLEVLLEHLDNQPAQLQSLWCALLSKREAWLTPLYQARFQDKTQYEAALKTLSEHTISRFLESIPTECLAPLLFIAQSIGNIEHAKPSPRACLADLNNLNDLTHETINGLASLLLTGQQTLRKNIDHHVGLKKGECDDKLYQTLKIEGKALLETLSTSRDFLDALIRAQSLPNPNYPEQQWETLQALLTLLPLLAAHLELQFNEDNTVDFTAIANQAVMALKHEDTPTELSLYLDNTIQHLLIDEFQDTSMQQFELISRLVEGFEPGDGRTLFVVGDPMQSIYRFRGAEVGLFLRAQQEGIGPVQLVPLALTTNFRSNETLVHWLNQQFVSIFPAHDDLESGAVSFHKAIPVKTAQPYDGVYAYSTTNPQEEAEAIIAQIKRELSTHPTDTIAILVRSRKQLTYITRTLRAHQLSYQGIDIDLIATLPHIQDIWSLTQALLFPANRLAWLAFLRSPWCGLSLADLHCLANINKHRSIPFALSQKTCLNALTEEGQHRIQFITQVLLHAQKQRQQTSLVPWIMRTLEALHCHAILNTQEQADLEQYWALIEQYESDGLLDNLELFKAELNALYSKQMVASPLQIMTIHKSKGLEFDSVILPGLNSRAAPADRPLLRLMKIPTKHQDELMLISPIKAAHHERCPLYDFIGRLDQEKNQYEIQRLLYVATTRAKKRLYLFDHSATPTKGTFRALLNQQDFTPLEPKLNEKIQEASLPTTLHLPISYYKTLPFIAPSHVNAPVSLSESTARIMGVIVHELLHIICTHHPVTAHDVPWTLMTRALKKSGLNAVPGLAEQIKTMISGLFDTPQGQWIIREHPHEKNEYALLVKNDNSVSTRIIDRTFVDNGICWIIDFKTGHEDFLKDIEHKAQVNGYALLMSHQTQLPIRCGLYYLNTHHWVEWAWAQSIPCDSLQTS